MKHILTLAIVVLIMMQVSAQAPVYKSRAEVPEQYTWNFNDIYTSWDFWKTDFEKLSGIVNELAAFQGTLSKSDAVLESYSRKQEEASKIAIKVYAYVMLQRTIDGRDQDINSRMQEIQNLFAKFGMATSWVSPELVAIPKDTMDKWTNKNSYLKQSKIWFMDIYRLQDHVLSTEKEEALSYYSKTLSASEETYKALANADLVYPEVTLSDSSVITASPVGVRNVMVNNPNQSDRLLASNEMMKVYVVNKNAYASIYAGILESRWADANVHKYNSCLESALSGDNIPVEVYHSLIKTAKENTAPLQKYIQLRKEALGLSTYYGSDAVLELVQNDTRFTYDEAKKQIEAALQPMGKTYIDKVSLALTSRWIDVYEVPGKEPGAYSMGIYGVHPYIMLNYGGMLDDNFTLAHELGHSMQTVFSNENQPYATADYSSFVAEVASTFNEHLLMDYLIKNAKSSNEKISLLVQQIENIFGTFYAQALFADWEYQMHTSAEQGIPVNEQLMSAKWDELTSSYYGSVMQKTEYTKFTWARVMHFYERQYYVYQYATSYAASSKLSQDVLTTDKKERQLATERYMQFLSAGSSDYPIQLLKNAGVDLTTPAPFEAVAKQMKTLVDQLEVELRKAGKIK
jgi:oligoendopeptidase F